MQNIKKIRFINLQVIPLNFLKLLTRIIDYVNQFIKKCNEFRNKEYLYWIKIGCSLALKNDRRKAWKWIKKNAKINNQFFTVSHSIKNNNNELVSSTDENLKGILIINSKGRILQVIVFLKTTGKILMHKGIWEV